MNISGRTHSQVISSCSSIAAATASRCSSGERDGLVIWYKRLEAGTFQQLDPAACAGPSSEAAGIELSATELTLLLTGVDLASARRRKRYARAG